MRAEKSWLIAIVVLAAILDLYCLGCAPLTHNESISYAVANSRGADFVQLAFRDKPETALYYLLLHGWIALGTSEFALRLFSVIFAVGSIPLLYALAIRLFDVQTALVAALLLATNASFMLQAQNARNYSMTAFLVLLATLLLVDRSAKELRARSILYVAAIAAAIYSHTLAILILPVHALWIFATDSSRARRIQFAKQMLALAILLIPAAWLIVRGQPDQFNWIPPLSAISFKDLFSGFLGAPYGPSNLLRRGCLILYSIAILLSAAGFARAAAGPRPRFAAWILAMGGFMIPALSLVGISLVHPLYQFRYLAMALPFFAMFIAAGLCATPYRTASSFLFCGIVALSLSIQFSIHRLPDAYPWPLLMRTLAERQQPGDALIVMPGFLRFPLDYYAMRVGAGDRVAIAYPAWDSRLRVDGHYIESFAMRGDNPFLERALQRNYSRFWIVLPSLGTPTSTAQLQSLAARYRCRASENFAELQLMRFDNCATPGANQ